MKTVSATVTSKGQITIPAPVRRAMGLKPGSRVLFQPQRGGYMIAEEIDPLSELKGCIPHGARKVEVEEMDGAMGKELSKKWAKP